MIIDNKNRPIIIIGGGIGGLTLALALLQDGHCVRVYEQAGELKEVGAGISLAPNCSKVFQQLGVAEIIARQSSVPELGELKNGTTGELLSTIPFVNLKSRFGYPYYQIHRADAHKILLDAVHRKDSDCIQLNHVFTNYSQTEKGVTVNFTNQPSTIGACVIGCDGIRSAVREQITGKQPARFTGFVAWRAIVPATQLPASYLVEKSNVRVHHQRQFVYYPIKSGTELNVSVFAEQDWKIESWTEKADKNELKALFQNFQQDVVEIIDAINSESCFKWALFDRDPINCWQDGRVVLLGDAAHPMLPFLGQGAAMAIEDAWFLAQALISFDEIETAFTGYQDARLERSSWVLSESRATGKRMGGDDLSPSTFSDDRAMHAQKMFGYDPVAESASAFS
jgi:salicylate hydroxylase